MVEGCRWDVADGEREGNEWYRVRTVQLTMVRTGGGMEGKKRATWWIAEVKVWPARVWVLATLSGCTVLFIVQRGSVDRSTAGLCLGIFWQRSLYDERRGLSL